MASNSFNAKNGLSVGSPPVQVIDSAGTLTPSTLGVGLYNFSYDSGFGEKLQVANPSNANKILMMGYSEACNAGVIHAVDKSIAWMPLLLQCYGGNVVVGATTQTGRNEKLQVTGAVSASVSVSTPQINVGSTTFNGQKLQVDDNVAAAVYSTASYTQDHIKFNLSETRSTASTAFTNALISSKHTPGVNCTASLVGLAIDSQVPALLTDNTTSNTFNSQGSYGILCSSTHAGAGTVVALNGANFISSNNGTLATAYTGVTTQQGLVSTATVMGAGSSSNVYALNGTATTQNTATHATPARVINGVRGTVAHNMSTTAGTVSMAAGAVAWSIVNSASADSRITNGFGLLVSNAAYSGPLSGTAVGRVSTAGGVDNAYGIHIGSVIGLTSAYGLHIGAMTGPTKWSIYSSDTATPSYIGGNLQLGSATPTVGAEMLQVTGKSTHNATVTTDAAHVANNTILTCNTPTSTVAQYATVSQIDMAVGASSTGLLGANKSIININSTSARGFVTTGVLTEFNVNSTGAQTGLVGYNATIIANAASSSIDWTAYSLFVTNPGVATFSNLIGYSAPNALTARTKTGGAAYGFNSNMNADATKTVFSFYSSGTAMSCLQGNLLLGTVTPTSGAEKLQVNGTASFTGDVSFSGTGAIRVPSGTTAQRTTAVQGQVRYNSDLKSFEGYDGALWVNLLSAQPSALGITNNVRQTVLSSSCTSNGDANFMTVSGTGGGPYYFNISAVSSTVPLIISFAKGYDSGGALDIVASISTTTPNILANFKSYFTAGMMGAFPIYVKSYLWVDRDTSGNITYGSTAIAPKYDNDLVTSVTGYNMDITEVGNTIVSGIYSTNYSHLALDSDPTNWWAPAEISANQSGTSWFGQDFAVNTIVRRISIYTSGVAANNMSSCLVQYWTGSAWTTITTWTMPTTINTWLTLDLTSNNVSATKIRIIANANLANTYGWRIPVIRFYGIQTDQHYFEISTHKMYKWTGASWELKTRVLLGEVQIGLNTTTGGATGTFYPINYAVRCRSRIERSNAAGTAFSPGSGHVANTNYTPNHMLGTLIPNVRVAYKFISADNGFMDGEEVQQYPNYIDGATARNTSLVVDKSTIYFATDTSTAINIGQRNSATNSSVNKTNLDLVFYCDRGW